MSDRRLTVGSPMQGNIASVFSGVFGWLVQRSQRNRLLRYIDDHLQIAERIAPFDTEAADDSRRVACRAARDLAARDGKWLRRHLDGVGVFTVVFLLGFGLTFGYWAYTWDGWWRWPAMCFAGVAILTAVIGGPDGVWVDEKDGEEPAAAEA